jgi:hypothetical protein
MSDRGRDPLLPLKYADIAIIVIALPIFIVASWPLLGWVTGAGVWLMWRGIGAWADRRAVASGDMRTFVGIETAAMIGRGWLLGLILIAVGLLAGNDVGLSAAVLAIVLFSVSFTFKLVTRAFDGPPGSKPSS